MNFLINVRLRAPINSVILNKQSDWKAPSAFCSELIKKLNNENI